MTSFLINLNICHFSWTVLEGWVRILQHNSTFRFFAIQNSFWQSEAESITSFSAGRVSMAIMMLNRTTLR